MEETENTYQKLFDYLYDELGVIALHTEMQEIIAICREIINKENKPVRVGFSVMKPAGLAAAIGEIKAALPEGTIIVVSPEPKVLHAREIEWLEPMCLPPPPPDIKDSFQPWRKENQRKNKFHK